MLTYVSHKILTNNFLLSIARASPIIIFFSTILLGAISSKRIFFILFLLHNVSELLNYILKYTAERILGNKYRFLIGYGRRPSNNLKTYGMPSGHSQAIATFCTFIALYNQKNTYKFQIYISLLFSTLYIMFSRVYEKFHTIQQTIIGALIGFGLAYYSYKIYSEFK